MNFIEKILKGKITSVEELIYQHMTIHSVEINVDETVPFSCEVHNPPSKFKTWIKIYRNQVAKIEKGDPKDYYAQELLRVEGNVEGLEAGIIKLREQVEMIKPFYEGVLNWEPSLEHVFNSAFKRTLLRKLEDLDKALEWEELELKKNRDYLFFLRTDPMAEEHAYNLALEKAKAELETFLLREATRKEYLEKVEVWAESTINDLLRMSND